MLSLFFEIFGQNFLDNLGFIFTRWGQSKKDKKSRQRNEDSEDKKIKSINDQLIELGITTEKDKQFKCFFIDNDLGKVSEQEIEDEFSEEEIIAH